MTIQIKEPDLIGLIAEIGKAAKQRLSFNSDDAVKDLKAALKKERHARRNRFEFEMSDAYADTLDTSGKETSVKGAIHNLTVKRRPNEGPNGAQIKRFQDVGDALLLEMHLHPDMEPTEFKVYGEYNRLANYLLKTEEKIAFSTGGSTTGAEFIPTQFSQQLIEKFRLELLVAGLFNRVTMPTNPYKLPLEGADGVAFVVAESTGTTPYTPTIPDSTGMTTSNLTMTAVKLACRTMWSSEMEADSIINIIDYARTKVAQAMANAVENADINGDNADVGAGKNFDDVVLSTGVSATAWAGLRKLARNYSSETNLGGADITTAQLRSLRGGMGKWGVRPSNLAWICSPEFWVNQFQTKIPEVQTLKDYGPGAVVLAGELARFDNIPIIPSEFVPNNLGADGDLAGGAGSTTSLILVNKSQFIHGDRQMLTIQTMDAPLTDQRLVFTKQRLCFIGLEGSSTQKTVRVGYNAKTTI